MVRAAAQFAAYTVLALAPVLGIHAIAYALVPEPTQPLPACASEDSTNCVWHADTQGNGEGRSFIDVEGKQIFISGRKG
jgi:hypothetical protein